MLGAQVSVLLQQQQHNITLQQHTRRVVGLLPHAATLSCAIARSKMVESGKRISSLQRNNTMNASAMEALQQHHPSRLATAAMQRLL